MKKLLILIFSMVFATGMIFGCGKKAEDDTKKNKPAEVIEAEKDDTVSSDAEDEEAEEASSDDSLEN